MLLIRIILVLILSCVGAQARARVHWHYSNHVGLATWYGAWYRCGHRYSHSCHAATHTANGETFNRFAMTAASRTLPFNTRLQVIDLTTHKNVIVRINDRMGAHAPRLIDLTLGAARRLGTSNRGIVPVRIVRLSTKRSA